MKKEIDPIKLEKEQDKLLLLQLVKVVAPTGTDMDNIEMLYKKYIEPGARPARRGGCNTCGNSIVNYWRALTIWFNQNQNLF